MSLYIRDIFNDVCFVVTSLNLNFKYLVVCCATEIKAYRNCDTKKLIQNAAFLSTLLNLKTSTQQNIHVAQICVIKLRFKFLINYSYYFLISFLEEK